MIRAILMALLLCVPACTAPQRQEALEVGAKAWTVTKTVCSDEQVVAAHDPALMRLVPGLGTADLVCEVVADAPF